MLITSLCCVLLASNVTADTLDTHLLPDASVDASSTTLRAYTSTSTSVQTISGQEMEILGIQQVAEALKLMNGVSVKDYGGLGGMKCVSVRNLGAQHTGVMYDGLPVSNCQAGQIDIARFNAQHLQEVRMGIGMLQDLTAPASMESYSGVLSMQSATIDKQTAAHAFASYSNWNTLQTGADLTSERGIGGVLSYRHTDGNRHNSRVDDGSGEVNLRHDFFSIPATLTAKLYGYYTDRQLPGGVILYNNEANETMQEGNILVQTRFEQELKDKGKGIREKSAGKWFAALKYNHALTFYNDGTALPNHTTNIQHQFNYWQNEYYGSVGVVGHPLSACPKLQTSLVYDIQQNHLHSNLTSARSVDRLTHQEVLRIQYLCPRLTLQGSLLATQFKERDSHHSWNPSLSASWLCFDHKQAQIRLRGMARKAYRLSSFNEEYYYQFGQHDLHPERADEVNFGATFNLQLSTLHFQLLADYYYNRVKDKIIAFPTTFAWKMSNLGEATSQGVETTLQVSQQLEHVQWDLVLNYELQKTQNLDDPNNANTYRKTLPYTPVNSGNGSLSCHLPWCTIGYTLECIGHRYSSIMNRKQYRMDPFQCHNLTVSKQIKRLNLQASVQNLTDEQYCIIQYYPMPTRQFRISINYQFK